MVAPHDPGVPAGHAALFSLANLTGVIRRRVGPLEGQLPSELTLLPWACVEGRA